MYGAHSEPVPSAIGIHRHRLQGGGVSVYCCVTLHVQVLQAVGSFQRTLGEHGDELANRLRGAGDIFGSGIHTVAPHEISG